MAGVLENAAAGEGTGAFNAPNTVDGRVEIFGLRYHLSGRERQVLQLIALGTAPKVIGDSIGCDYSSVRTYLKRMYRKIGCSGGRELMIRFFSETMVSPQGGE